jgi:hypothetical protein
MLVVTNNPQMLDAVMLNVVAPQRQSNEFDMNCTGLKGRIVDSGVNTKNEGGTGYTTATLSTDI